MLAVYLVFTVTFCLVLTWSVLNSVLAMNPKVPAASEPLGAAVCLTRLRELINDLDLRNRNISALGNVTTSDLKWSEYRLQWLTRSRELESHCSLKDPANVKLEAAFKQADHVLDLYTVHAVQFAGEIGPSIDALRVMLDEANH